MTALVAALGAFFTVIAFFITTFGFQIRDLPIATIGTLLTATFSAVLVWGAV